jgi:hypothetical protein
MTEKVFFVYLLASGLRGTLYVGVTSDLSKRIWEHKTKAVSGFTARYGVDRRGLVRAPRERGVRDPAREADQGMEARLEIQPDRAG